MIKKNPKWIQLEWIRNMENYTGQNKIAFLSLKLGYKSPSFCNTEYLAIKKPIY